MSVNVPKDVYACDGELFEFTITFPFAHQQHVLAFLTHDETGVRKLLIPNLDYVIDGATLRTRVDEYKDPWPAGYTLTILRAARRVQGSSQHMTPLVFRLRVNQITQLVQQLKEKLDRTLQTGVPYPALDLTSKLYAYINSDALSVSFAPRNASFGAAFLDAASFGFGLLGGSLDTIVDEYEDWPVEELDMAFALLSGTLVSPIIEYEDWPEDEMDLAFALLSGTLVAPIVEYEEWDVEEVELSFALLSGSLV